MYKLIAHRGYKDNSKENTMDAFKKSIDSDFYGFECDVRQTKDKQFVIIHNPIYKGKLVRTLNLNEFDNILLLKDVLKIDSNKIIMLDIKDPLLDTNELLKLIKDSDKNIYIISFHNNIIDKLYNKGKYKVGVLNYILNNSKEKYDFSCYLGIFQNFKFLKLLEQNKKEIFVYGINKADIKNDYPYYIVD